MRVEIGLFSDRSLCHALFWRWARLRSAAPKPHCVLVPDWTWSRMGSFGGSALLGSLASPFPGEGG